MARWMFLCTNGQLRRDHETHAIRIITIVKHIDGRAAPGGVQNENITKKKFLKRAKSFVERKKSMHIVSL